MQNNLEKRLSDLVNDICDMASDGKSKDDIWYNVTKSDLYKEILGTKIEISKTDIADCFDQDLDNGY